MNKHENQRVMLTKRLLKEHLTELLQEKSIQKITVVELCSGAGIHRSTFYTHYGCVLDVFKEMEDDFIAELEEIWQNERNKRPKLPEWRTETLCKYLKEHEKTARTVLGNNGVDSEFAGKLIHSCFIREAFQEDISDRFDADTADMLFYFLSRGQYSMVRHWLLENDGISPEKMSWLINDVARNGWIKSSDEAPRTDRSTRSKDGESHGQA